MARVEAERADEVRDRPLHGLRVADAAGRCGLPAPGDRFRPALQGHERLPGKPRGRPSRTPGRDPPPVTGARPESGASAGPATDMERKTGFEPATSTLARWRSTGLSYFRSKTFKSGAF